MEIGKSLITKIDRFLLAMIAGVVPGWVVLRHLRLNLCRGLSARTGSLGAWVRSLTVGPPVLSWSTHHARMRKSTRQPDTALRRVKSMTNSIPFPALSYPIFWLVEVSCATQSSIIAKAGWQRTKIRTVSHAAADATGNGTPPSEQLAVHIVVPDRPV